MILLVLSVVLSFVSLHHSALVGDSADLQIAKYNKEIEILLSLLAEECPEYIQQKRDMTDLQKLRLEVRIFHVLDLEQQLLKCRQGKHVSTTNRSTAVVTDPAPFCPSYDGDSVFNMLFISYTNPTTKKAPGVLCRTDGSPCSISLEICVSPIASTSCGYYHHVTDVMGEKPENEISNNFGNLTNPLKINVGSRNWKGAHVHITVLNRNPANSLRAYRDVDEFSFDLTDAQGSPPRLVTLHGKHVTDKAELMMMFTVPCPSPSTTLPTTRTTLPTTPTTLPATTTSFPVPAECLTVTNLTQSARLDHNGKGLRGGGPHSNYGLTCDMYDMGWFRFTGAAGTHMLDKCPKWKSCGTHWSLWTDGMLPQAVGVPANITAYHVYEDDCKAGSYPVQVMRCSLSTDHDLIYRYKKPFSGNGTCNTAFCGMN